MSFVYLIFHWVFFFLSCCGYNWKTWNRACGGGGGGGGGQREEAHVVQAAERVFTVSAVSRGPAAVLPSAHHPPKYNDLSF